MKMFTKKIFAALLAAAVSSVITSGCFAVDSDEWKNNIGEINLDSMKVTGSGVAVDGNTIKITDGGDFNVSGTLAHGMIYVNSDEKVKLRLSGASISNSAGPAIFFDNAEKAFITITEGTENYLSDGKTYSTEDADSVLFSNDDLEIKGDGILNITGNYQHGIAGDDDVSIENGIININSYEHGIKANDTLSVSGGEITVTSETGKGMKADLEVIIDDGTINITSKQSEGIESKGTLTINGGDINVISADDGINTGNESTGAEKPGDFEPRENNGEMPDMPNGGRHMRGDMPMPPEGSARPDAKVPQNREMARGDRMNGRMAPGGMGRGGMMDEETAAAHAITINGGNIHISAEGDGIDSNGGMTINGGTIIVDGPTGNGNGPLDSEGGITMNGGTVITASSAGMLQLPAAADGINIMQVFFDGEQAAGTTVSVKEASSGTELMTMTPTKNFRAIVFASRELKSGTDYTIYINGNEYESFTVSAGTTTIGTAGFDGFGGRGNGLRGNPANGMENRPTDLKSVG